jgi:hypothetical protein
MQTGAANTYDNNEETSDQEDLFASNNHAATKLPKSIFTSNELSTSTNSKPNIKVISSAKHIDPQTLGLTSPDPEVEEAAKRLQNGRYAYRFINPSSILCKQVLGLHAVTSRLTNALGAGETQCALINGGVIASPQTINYVSNNKYRAVA